MNIAICDDCASDAEEIRSYLLAYFKQHGFTGNFHLFGSGEALLAAFQPGHFDVLFLDIFLKGISGVETAQRIRECDPNCLLVFVTTSDSHMRDGFALRVASYVEKPLTPEKLQLAFEQCHSIFMKNARYIEIKLTQRDLKLPFTRIMYAEAIGRHVLFHIDTGETFESRMKMDDAEQQLSCPPFIRCHQSFIVNMNHVVDVQGNDLLLKTGQMVPIRKNGRREAVDTLNRFMTERLFGES